MATGRDGEEPLLSADHGAGSSGQEAAEEQAAAAGSSEGGEEATLAGSPHEQSVPGSSPCLPPERSALSRQASLTGLPPLPPPKGRSTFVIKTAGWFITTLLLGILAVGGLVLLAFGPPPAGAAPAARTGAALAMLPAVGNASQRLVVYSGQGQSGFLFKDVHTYDLKTNEWRKVKNKDLEAAARSQQLQPPPQPPPQLPPQQQQQRWRASLPWGRRKPTPEPPQPCARWKAASAQLAGGLGLLVHGGDSPTKEGPLFRNDTWLLRFPDLRWQQASSGGGGTEGQEQPGPKARRSHSLVSYQDAEGRQLLLLFGGRRDDGLLLNDVWQGAVDSSGGNFSVAWTLLSDPQAGVGQGPAPLPRRGHVAVMWSSPEGPKMVVHGGRSEVYGSFTDVWLFDPNTTRWQPLAPTTAVQPAPRDHHGGALWAGHLFIFGGRFGTVEEALRPIGDRWLFDLQSRQWRQLPVRGMSPLPRFLFGYAQYTPTGGGADRFVLFGGQTGASCKLNDVWQLSLDSNLWQQVSQPYFTSKRCERLFG
ncbi:leucine-zipper-like transcriptional regulator 1 isoform X1 [Chlorella sorokiniana]|uniref:Leucine-zipper-like transcriptional regulator 1 isoform X1 n=1 Tax=Chlorella sorokiniana TaxID=3076 RepID=A0A2P6U090_CHLSO|nr:leucine-zipper-like transcriptional regulator 1 isoform X1 [Chlorella sorokiniana]|eukprot:PRW59710.1 leucine-zipper-like transcriptional regulator 1 isoform X1 [Chlorella sorokiniana]